MVRLPAAGCHPSIDTSVGAMQLTLSSRAASAALLSFVVAACAGMTVMLGFLTFPASAQLKREQLTLLTARGEIPIEVELAETAEQKQQGLMFRRSLPERSGMLFLYEGSGEITMWMKNTYIPLDMVFIRADGVVHRIEAMTTPFSEEVISSKGTVAAVLELSGGAAERFGLRPGDKVLHRYFGMARR
jgi:hypothetical protein